MALADASEAAAGVPKVGVGALAAIGGADGRTDLRVSGAEGSGLACGAMAPSAGTPTSVSGSKAKVIVGVLAALPRADDVVVTGALAAVAGCPAAAITLASRAAVASPVAAGNSAVFARLSRSSARFAAGSVALSKVSPVLAAPLVASLPFFEKIVEIKASKPATAPSPSGPAVPVVVG